MRRIRALAAAVSLILILGLLPASGAQAAAPAAQYCSFGLTAAVSVLGTVIPVLSQTSCKTAPVPCPLGYNCVYRATAMLLNENTVQGMSGVKETVNATGTGGAVSASRACTGLGCSVSSDVTVTGPGSGSATCSWYGGPLLGFTTSNNLIQCRVERLSPLNDV